MILNNDSLVKSLSIEDIRVRKISNPEIFETSEFIDFFNLVTKPGLIGTDLGEMFQLVNKGTKLVLFKKKFIYGEEEPLSKSDIPDYNNVRALVINLIGPKTMTLKYFNKLEDAIKKKLGEHIDINYQVLIDENLDCYEIKGLSISY